MSRVFPVSKGCLCHRGATTLEGPIWVILNHVDFLFFDVGHVGADQLVVPFVQWVTRFERAMRRWFPSCYVFL